MFKTRPLIDPTPRYQFSQHATVNPSFAFDPSRHLVSMNSLQIAIKSRANKKSKGADNISNFLIKKLSPKFKILLAILFNQAYNMAFFPTEWKTALIIPILKNPNQRSSQSAIDRYHCYLALENSMNVALSKSLMPNVLGLTSSLPINSVINQ